MTLGKQKRLLIPLSILLFAAAMGLVLLRLVAVSRSVVQEVHADWAMVDFRSAVYYPAAAFVAGDNPYDRQAFLARYPSEDAFPPYLPATLLLNAPLTLMKYPTAAVFYFAAMVVCTGLVALLALRLAELPAEPALVLAVTATMILSRPGHMNLLVGQGTLIYVAGVYLALCCAATSPGWSALGVCLAALKPTFGIPLVLLMLAQRRFKPLLLAVVLGALMNLPPLLLVVRNAGGVGPFVGSVTADFGAWRSEPVVDPEKSLLLVSASGVAGKILGRPLGGPGEAALAILILGAAALALRTLAGRDDVAARTLGVTLVGLATLTAFHHQPYDLLILTLPAIALFGGKLPAAFREPGNFWPLAVLFVLLGFNYLATYSGVGALALDGVAYRVVTSINGLALLAAFALVVTASIKPLPAAARAAAGP